MEHRCFLADIVPPIDAKRAVTVVPILAPNTNPRDAFSVSASVWYSDCTIPTMALEDCITPVTIAPTIAPRTGVVDILTTKVSKPSMFLNL